MIMNRHPSRTRRLRDRVERSIQAISISALIAFDSLGVLPPPRLGPRSGIERLMDQPRFPIHPLERLDEGTIISLPYEAAHPPRPAHDGQIITLN